MAVKASCVITLARVDDGDTGANGTMLFGTCVTAAATVAKTTSITGFSLYKGVTISVYFSYANSASSPTLNVNSTGAKGIRTNGVAYAYWAAGSAVTFVYDGTYWQVTSIPVYGNTATIGNPSGFNTFIGADSVNIRKGTTTLATFLQNLVKFLRSDGSANLTVSTDSEGNSVITSDHSLEISVPNMGHINMLGGGISFDPREGTLRILRTISNQTNEYDVEIYGKTKIPNLVRNSDAYSGAEANINKTWVNGKTIYRKTIEISANAQPHGITGLTFVTSISAMYYAGNTYGWREGSNDVTIQNSIIWLTGNMVNYVNSSKHAFVTIEYTK